MRGQKVDRFFLIIIFLLLALGVAMFISASLGILAKNEKIFYAALFSQLVLGLGFGFLSMYLEKISSGGFNVVTILLGAIIFWDLMSQSQRAISTTFLEEVWERNRRIHQELAQEFGWVTVNANGEPEGVHARIRDIILPRLG